MGEHGDLETSKALCGVKARKVLNCGVQSGKLLDCEVKAGRLLNCVVHSRIEDARKRMA